MKLFRKCVAAALSAVLLYSIIGSSMTGVFAAVSKVYIDVDSYSNGTLNISWSLSGAKAAVIEYHTPNADNTAGPIQTITVLNKSTTPITGLKADYIYDIHITVYSDVSGSNPSGEIIGEGLLFYLPSITFTSEAPEQSYVTISGGGREIGVLPKLRLTWKEPYVFNGTDMFIPAGSPAARTYMASALNGVYGGNINIAKLNYRINISTALNLLNSGSKQASILLTQTGSAYEAAVSGVPDKTADVVTTGGAFSFELWGRESDSAALPAIPSNDAEHNYDDVLPDGDLLPGTVYYMNIKPIFVNSDNKNVSVLTACNPDDDNGSILSGGRQYTSTPIRFQVTKDSANNIYVKIYKINQGSLDLPRLYYEIQATDDPSIRGDWQVKKTMDDSYFSGISAVTVITGVNPNNEVYYKIVVKSDSPGDRLESLPLPYTLTVDTSRPPLPTGITVIDRDPVTKSITSSAITTDVSIKVTSTDVTLSWDKPLNWDSIKNDLVFHFLLSTSQTDLAKKTPIFVNGVQEGSNGDQDVKLQWGSQEGYDVKYRLVKYIDASRITVSGNKLVYTLKGFDLFTYETSPGGIGLIPRDAGDEDYPGFLLPNTVYYLQMYTTNRSDAGTKDTSKWSDRSIITSFTTLDGARPDVPLPGSLSLNKNGTVKTTSGTAVNYVEVKFDKVNNINWNDYTANYDETQYKYSVYYDIYMNTRTNTPFRLVGTTQYHNGDLGFTGDDDLQSTSVIVGISSFTKDQESNNLFGDYLRPNTTYYLKVRTRLVIQKRTDPTDVTTKESIDTAILPITTKVLVITPPNDNQRKPLAPTDFDIAVGDDGNPRVDGNSVTFTWTRPKSETGVIYQIIKTTRKINPTDGADKYSNDPEYQSFLEAYGHSAEDAGKGITATNGAIYLDLESQQGSDPNTLVYTLKVDRRMFPNRLYYFSLKAVRVDGSGHLLNPSSESVWVCVPVTTSLIDQPNSLEAVVGSELGFYWTDATLGLTPEDYKIYKKGPSDSDYKLLTRSQATIVKDADGETYYGRISGLAPDTYYDIRVTKGTDTPVYEKTGVKTRDAYHEIEVMWIGKPQEAKYESYELAIAEEGASDYTVLTAADLEQYTVKRNGEEVVLPYYTEETARTVNKDDALYYHARIKSVTVTLPGGVQSRQPLKSNTKYYIKVRAVKIDSVQSDIIAYSKYIGPVNIRTEFNQGDYDNNDREEQQKAIFMDRMEELEKGYYWRVDIASNQSVCILLKGDRVSDAMKNSALDSFTLDLTSLSINIGTDEVYVPITVIRTMNSLNRNLVIRTSGAELILRPKSIDASGDLLKAVTSRQEVKDLYVRLAISRPSASSIALPANQEKVSGINELDVQAIGLSRTDEDMAKLIHDRLYDEDTGLVSEMLNLLESAYVGTGTGSSDLMNQYTQSLIDKIQKDLSAYIDQTIDSFRLPNAVKDITAFDAPVSVSLACSGGSGAKVPYVLYDGASAWQKVVSSSAQGTAGVAFNLLRTGRFVIMSAVSSPGSVPSGHWAEGYIKELTSKYDLSGIFQGMQNNFMPDNRVTCREVVLLYQTVTGRTAENAGLDIRQTNAKLGLDKIINPNSLQKNIKRQETAAVLLNLFSAKKGINAAAIKPAGRTSIKDENSIGDVYYQPVLIMVDIKVMELDGSGRFNPDSTMTRAEVVTAFTKLLKQTGDL